MISFVEFFAEAVVERRAYKVRCRGVDFACEPILIDRPRGTPTKTFQHAAKTKFLSKAFYRLNPPHSIHEFIRRNYNNCSLEFKEELSVR